MEQTKEAVSICDVDLDDFCGFIHFPISIMVLESALAFAASRTKYSRHATRISSE